MSAAVRPIHVPGAQALDSLRVRVRAAVAEWARQWMNVAKANDDRSALHVRVADRELRSLVHEYAAVRSGTGCLWFRRSAADRASFGRAVVGAELMPRSACADDWIAGIVEQAWEILTHTLCSQLLGASVAPAIEPQMDALPMSLFAFGSGAVHLSCDSLGLYAIADQAIWRSVPPTERDVSHLSKLAPLDRAARRAALRLDVMLGSVEIELPKVLDLRCGDVLRLPQRLDEPLAVLCEGKPLARAALGEVQGRKSVQVVANHV